MESREEAQEAVKKDHAPYESINCHGQPPDHPHQIAMREATLFFEEYMRQHGQHTGEPKFPTKSSAADKDLAKEKLKTASHHVGRTRINERRIRRERSKTESGGLRKTLELRKSYKKINPESSTYGCFTTKLPDITEKQVKFITRIPRRTYKFQPEKKCLKGSNSDDTKIEDPISHKELIFKGKLNQIVDNKLPLAPPEAQGNDKLPLAPPEAQGNDKLPLAPPEAQGNDKLPLAPPEVHGNGSAQIKETKETTEDLKTGNLLILEYNSDDVICIDDD